MVMSQLEKHDNRHTKKTTNKQNAQKQTGHIVLEKLLLRYHRVTAGHSATAKAHTACIAMSDSAAQNTVRWMHGATQAP